MSDVGAAQQFQVDRRGGLHWEGAGPLPSRLYLASWSAGTGCSGLAYTLQPLTVLDSRAAGGGLMAGDQQWYALSCAHNRTAWCQHGYKAELAWPAAMSRTCRVIRTGVDKSRCYLAGRLEVRYKLECSLAGGGVEEAELVYHLLQDPAPAHRSPHSRVRRALTANPPFFDRPHYTVNVAEEGGKQSTVSSVQASDPRGGELRYSITALVDSRSQEMFSIDPYSAVITTNSKLDREFMDVHYLRVVATTTESPQLTATTTLQVSLNTHLHTTVFVLSLYFSAIQTGCPGAI